MSDANIFDKTMKLIAFRLPKVEKSGSKKTPARAKQSKLKFMNLQKLNAKRVQISGVATLMFLIAFAMMTITYMKQEFRSSRTSALIADLSDSASYAARTLALGGNFELINSDTMSSKLKASLSEIQDYGFRDADIVTNYGEAVKSISAHVERVMVIRQTLDALSNTIKETSKTESLLDGSFKEVQLNTVDGGVRPDVEYILMMLHKIDYDLMNMKEGNVDAIAAMPAKVNAIKPVISRLSSDQDKQVRLLVDSATATINGLAPVIDNSQEIVDTEDDLRSLVTSDVYVMKDLLTVLNDKIQEQKNKKLIYFIGFDLAMMFICLTALIYFYLQDLKEKGEKAKDVNDANEQSIIKMIEDLERISSGDLTHQAVVSEHITGVIADSLNDTIFKIRKIILVISGVVKEIKTGSDKSAEAYAKLNQTVINQVSEIDSANQAVQMIVESISDVNESAKNSSNVAAHALEVTNKGSKATKDAIDGMNIIRDNIQETSKRIKRLGESSQEIGDIVSLVSNIAEQTNVLALNAALQAVSAGDAGKGFAIVAEEVQRLAERSSNAASQIAQLVHLIQNDAHDAVAAMEKSTEGVVNGANLALAAGDALGEIEHITNKLAALINSITVSTNVQTEMSDSAINAMKKTLDASGAAKEQSLAMKEVVTKIIESAYMLETSFSGFKA